MAEGELSVTKFRPDENYVVYETKYMDQDTSLNSDFVSKLYNVLCTEKDVINGIHNENNSEQGSGRHPISSDENDAKHTFFSESQDISFLPESVCSISETVSPVTHIEIIKSSSRRVTGANRVVPLLTSTLKTGKLADTDFKLSEVYKAFFNDLENNDSNKKCLICLRDFLSCTELEHHVRKNHVVDVTTDQCFVCRRKYIFQDQLRIHLTQNHNINHPDLICKICFMEFSTIMEQKAHERKHDESRSCHMCPKKFSSEYLYQKHLNVHIFQVKPNECEMCDRRFKNVISLDIHKKRHVNIACSVCKLRFPTDTDLLLHMKIHDSTDVKKFLKSIERMDEEESHLEEMLALYIKLTAKTRLNTLKDSEADPQDSILECVDSMVSAVSQSCSDSVKNNRGTECRLCGISVSTEKELLDHRKQFHLRNRTCPFCGKRSRSVSQTWRHMNSHLVKNKVNISKLPLENDKPSITHSDCSKDDNEVSSCLKNKQPWKITRLYNCNICSRKFMYPGSRDNHVLQHSKDNCSSWKCAVCGQVFSHPSLLLTHTAAHEPSPQCEICDKLFLSQRSLQSHIKTHFGEKVKKVFKCNICSVKCPSLAGLKDHCRCHTGERPYSCGQCHRRFKRRQAVKKHIEVVHNSASLQYYSCSQCPKMFNSSGNLIRHYLRVHCQVRRFICGICGSRFSQNQDLRRHFKVSHEIDMPNIKGSDRKALREVYVIPDLSDTNPHALKIKAIVAEEKAKFSRLSDLLMSKGIFKEDVSINSVVQVIQDFSKEGKPVSDELQPSIEEDIATKEHQTNAIGKKCQSRNSLNSSNSNSNNDSNSEKLYTCENCQKSFPGEIEFTEHIVDRRKSYVCMQCGSEFCNKGLLEGHICYEQDIMTCSFSENNVNSEENNLKNLQSSNGIEVTHSVSNISCVFRHENYSVVQGRTLITPIEQQKVYSRVVTDASDNDVGSAVLSKPSLPISVNTERSNLSTMLNINGIVLQNVIIEQAPTVLQSLPVDLHSQRLVNATSHMPPVITFDSSAVATVESHPPYFNVNGVHSGAISSVVDSTNPLTFTDDVLENRKRSIITVNPSQIEKNNYIPEMNEDETITERNDEIKGGGNGGIFKPKHNSESCGASDRDSKTDDCKGRKELKCKYCEEKFLNVSTLNCHMKTHSENKPFGCPDCGKHFSEKCNLKVHLMTHTGERPYKCEDCGKKFRYRKDILDHKHMHLGEKPFVCDECGRKFIRQRELNRHKWIHSGEKKHECPICGKMFGRLDQLRHAHMPTHEDSNFKHTCNICKKSFRLKSTVKQHELLHSGLKPYKCDLCKKSFALDIYLKAHIQCHQKRHNYLQCPKCPRRFMSEATLQVHEKTFHLRHKKFPKSTKDRSEETSWCEDQTLVKNGNVEQDGEIGEGDVEIHDVDFSILDSNNCNAVIYLQMAPEELKLSLNGIES